ncbi:MAG: alpha-ribazole phosphatase [Pseudomonadota bacterium]
MALWLIRHTAPDIPPGICYGQSDVALAASFETDAQAVIAAMPNATTIITSPLQRCQRLAGKIAASLNIPIKADKSLMEMDFGAWEGRPWDHIPRHEIDQWAADFWHAKPHGGESVCDLKTRADFALQTVASAYENAAVVTHAGIIKAAFATGTTADAFNRSPAFGEIVEWEG